MNTCQRRQQKLKSTSSAGRRSTSHSYVRRCQFYCLSLAQPLDWTSSRVRSLQHSWSVLETCKWTCSSCWWANSSSTHVHTSSGCSLWFRSIYIQFYYYLYGVRLGGQFIAWHTPAIIVSYSVDQCKKCPNHCRTHSQINVEHTARSLCLTMTVIVGCTDM